MSAFENLGLREQFLVSWFPCAFAPAHCVCYSKQWWKEAATLVRRKGMGTKVKEFWVGIEKRLN